jgi:hypothetical protein
MGLADLANFSFSVWRIQLLYLQNKQHIKNDKNNAGCNKNQLHLQISHILFYTETAINYPMNLCRYIVILDASKADKYSCTTQMLHLSLSNNKLTIQLFNILSFFLEYIKTVTHAITFPIHTNNRNISSKIKKKVF